MELVQPCCVFHNVKPAICFHLHMKYAAHSDSIMVYQRFEVWQSQGMLIPKWSNQSKRQLPYHEMHPVLTVQLSHHSFKLVLSPFLAGSLPSKMYPDQLMASHQGVMRKFIRIYSNEVSNIFLILIHTLLPLTFARLSRFCPFDKGSRAPNLCFGQKIIMCFTLGKKVLHVLNN